MERLVYFKGKRKTIINLQRLTEKIEDVKGVDPVILADWDDTKDGGTLRVKGTGTFDLSEIFQTITFSNYVLNYH